MFTRSKNNPILKPNKNHDWESRKVYNCGAIYEDNKYHLFYRAVGDNWISSLGYAVSEDGENFKRFDRPILFSETDLEKGGVEDPRITKIGDTFFMVYAAYDGLVPRLNIATSNDLKKWHKQGKALTNFNFDKAGGIITIWQNGKLIKVRQDNEWSKSGGIFPKKINNKYWMLFGEYKFWLAESDNGINWKFNKKPLLKTKINTNYFDSVFIEMGPPPIKTDVGWLILYHGIDKQFYYRLGFLILDLNNPTKILYRSEQPIFEPEEPYELSGIVDILPGGLKAMEKMNKEELNQFLKQHEKTGGMPKVTFCCGAVVVDGILRIYYGASDSVICTATAKLDDILNIYRKDN